MSDQNSKPPQSAGGQLNDLELWAHISRATSDSLDVGVLYELFTYHSWTAEQAERGTEVRKALMEAVRTIIVMVPPCPTRTVAIRKLVEARMDCNAAITFGG